MSNIYYNIDNIYDHVGQYFRDKRKDAGITQRDLAAAMGISTRQIVRFENGSTLNSNFLLKMMILLRIKSTTQLANQVKNFDNLKSMKQRK